jgi:tetratricopeptide (TPR) repeat protein
MGNDGFFGRRRELEELHEALGAARAGRGRLVLVSGEPGIGKSRLVDEFAAVARDDGAAVLAGRCWEAGGAPPYWPWVQILRACLRGRDPAALRAELGAGTVDVAQMLPEIRDLYPDLGQPPAVDPESARFRLLDSTTSFLRKASATRALVLLLEDLHAADVPSLLLLRFLTGQLADAALLVVATYRDMEVTPEHPLRSVLADLVREPNTRRIALGGLAESDVGRFLEQAAGVMPAPAFVSAMHSETSGNPLFLVETVRLLAAEGHLADLPDAATLRIGVPEGVRDVIGRRLARVDEQGRQLLGLASVLGAEFSVETLARLAELDAARVLDALDRVVADGIVESVAGAPGRLRFSHALVRETLYRDLSPARRVGFHRRAAGVLEELFPNDPSHLAELAHHSYEAAATGEADRAIEYAERAGRQAVTSLAYEEAVRLFAMAVQLLEVTGPLDEERLGEDLLALGEAQARTGQYEEARVTMLRAAALARRTGAAEQLGRAALGYGGRFLWARAGHDVRLVPLLESALDMLGEGNDGLCVRLLARLACALRNDPDRERSAALSLRALTIAREHGETSTLAYALVGRVWAVWWPENPEERLGLAREVLEVAEEGNDDERVADALLGMIGAYSEMCSMREARAALDTVVVHAESLRQPALIWAVRGERSLSALMEGEFESAERLLEEPKGFGPHTAPRDDLSARRFQLFLLRREQDRLQEVETMARASIEEFPWYPLWRAAYACLLLGLERVEEARVTFEELAADRFSVLLRDSEWLLGMALACEACAGLGDVARAELLYSEYLPFARRHAIGKAEGSVGPVARYLGLLATTLGRYDDAEEHFLRGAELSRRMGAHPWLAHARHDHARMLLLRDGPGDAERAVTLLSEAEAVADRLGMVVLSRSVGTLLEQLGERSSEVGNGAPAGGDAGSGADGVFRREGEYWSVAFDGTAVRLRDSKGMAYLARLLADPGREFHVLDLVGAGRAATRAAGREDGPTVRAAEAFGDAGAILDPTAKAAYRNRLVELEADIDEAQARGDADAAERARTEREFLVRELASAVGLGGRDRVAASASERARVNVTRAVRAALVRISEQAPSLGRHLAATVRTGTYCAYVPDPRQPTVWRV